MIEKLQNEHIIITHTTQRTPIQEMRKILKEVLSPATYEKVVLFMDRRRG